VKPAMVYGETDDFAWKAVDGKVHVHDLHATILHLLGLDHERLTYRYSGRDFSIDRCPWPHRKRDSRLVGWDR
jgi:Protein of unknown function (DUF1501)